MTVNTKSLTTLKERIDWLAQFGNDRKGVTRLLYTQAWTEAVQALEQWMQEIGFVTYYDGSGNLFGRVEGKKSGSVVLTGSHIDTVRSGGKYDGSYGILSSIFAIQKLVEAYGKPDKTIEVVAICEEEGSRFPFAYLGSKYITGAVTKDVMNTVVDQNGVSMWEARKEAGVTASFHEEARTDIDRYIEVHIEQGKILETSGEDIGIVDAIVGQRRLHFYVEGEANHAGTTPMRLRKDAMEGASEMVQGILSYTREEGAPLVATVGQMNVSPNSVNVIPGCVRFSLDIRHPDQEKLEAVCQYVKDRCAAIAEVYDLKLSIKPFMSVNPVQMSERMNKDLEAICTKQHITFQHMYSGAGHDAQIIGEKYPTSLLFVPSKGGVSHSPEEFTSIDQLEKGVSVLQEALLTWCYEGGEKL